MKTRNSITFLIGALLMAQTAFAATKDAAKSPAVKTAATKAVAATPARTPASSPQRLLGIEEGDYAVSNSQPANARDKVCGKDSVHTIAWAGTAQDPVLSIGEAAIFNDIGLGLKIDSDPSYGDECSYSNNTQVDSRRLTMDSIETCKSQTSTTHTELRNLGGSLEFVMTKKMTKNGRSRDLRTSCVLKKL